MNDYLDLVIFDCDGVLVDSEVLAVEVDKRILAELGWHLSTAEIVDRFLGTSARSFQAQVEAHLGITMAPDWEERYRPWFVEAFEAELRAVPGIEDALDAITVPTCVASSGSHEKIRTTLGLTGLLGRFEGRIHSSSEVAHGKPAPDIFLHAAARMGAAPERAVVIEDSKYGVRAARAAGMRAFGYAGGLTPAAWLEQEGAIVFTDMAELPALLRAHAPDPE
ncbi:MULTISPECIES: HAD family hydrolase [Clavibacter]|uniref:Haloacid dehalogenase n=1 Tax=Clavibacter tessellarius TaxID=31965 RepID=A0A154V562_9MICO|nr:MULTISPECIES: HAD-IA family hydrolase [Clavibacter]KZC96518.1 haloacid dehalogenase [Clavibacter michiganensis subsp. tessellarius]MDA3804098.1 HAD-IA family hydrolase [Clavibacter sp. CT19]